MRNSFSIGSLIFVGGVNVVVLPGPKCDISIKVAT